MKAKNGTYKFDNIKNYTVSFFDYSVAMVTYCVAKMIASFGQFFNTMTVALSDKDGNYDETTKSKRWKLF